jgi:CBS domain-containing protein
MLARVSRNTMRQRRKVDAMPTRPVREIIERDQLVAVAPTTTVKEAVAAMAGQHCGSVVVLDADAFAGIFTERDLMLRVVDKGLDPLATPIAAVMTADPDTIDADAPVAEAIRAMDELGCRYLPVLDAGRCIGVISTGHLPFSDLLDLKDELEARHTLAERMW